MFIVHMYRKYVFCLQPDLVDIRRPRSVVVLTVCMNKRTISCVNSKFLLLLLPHRSDIKYTVL